MSTPFDTLHGPLADRKADGYCCTDASALSKQQRTAERSNPLLETEQPERTGLRKSGLLDPDTVIGDVHGDEFGIGSQDDVDAGCVRVSSDIRQRFLSCPEE